MKQTRDFIKLEGTVIILSYRRWSFDNYFRSFFLYIFFENFVARKGVVGLLMDFVWTCLNI